MNSWHTTVTILNVQMSPIGSSVTRAQSRSRRTIHSYRGIHPTEASQLADITRVCDSPFVAGSTVMAVIPVVICTVYTVPQSAVYFGLSESCEPEVP